MPNTAWVEQKKANGKVITDYLAAQAAGRYLKLAIETGYDNGREMYTMSVAESVGERGRGDEGSGAHGEPSGAAGGGGRCASGGVGFCVAGRAEYGG